MQSKKIKVSYLIAILSVIIVIAISLVVSKDKSETQNVKTPDILVKEDGGLPSVYSFENLYNILGISNKKETSESENVIEENTIDNNTTNSTDEETTEVNEEQTVVEEKEPEITLQKADENYAYYELENIVYIVTEGSKGLKTVSKIDFSNTEEEKFKINELYIKENKIIVVYTKELLNPSDNRNIFTVAEIYNTKNKRRPRLEREIKVEGEYFISKSIGNNIYIITNKDIHLTNYYGLAIENINEKDFKILYNDTSFDEEKYLEFDKMYYFKEEKEYNKYLNIIGIDINDEIETEVNSYLGAGDDIYLFNTGLYMSKTIYDYKDTAIYGYYDNLDINTYIYKFNYEDTNIKYSNVGNVQGDIFNNLNEFDNTIRVITEDSTTWESTTKINSLYVLNLDLEVVGKLENFIQGESLSKAEFSSNTLKVETKLLEEIKQYNIDLTVPTNPQII